VGFWERLGPFRCRQDLKNPPTAVGGIPGEARAF
jgi:hypothetical protein